MADVADRDAWNPCRKCEQRESPSSEQVDENVEGHPPAMPAKAGMTFLQPLGATGIAPSRDFVSPGFRE